MVFELSAAELPEDRVDSLAEYLAILIKRGRRDLAHQVVDSARFVDCLQPATREAVQELLIAELPRPDACSLSSWERLLAKLERLGCERVQDLPPPAELAELRGLGQGSLDLLYLSLDVLGGGTWRRAE